MGPGRLTPSDAVLPAVRSRRATNVSRMISDTSSAAPPGDRAARLTGLPARTLGRTALAGVLAEVGAVVLMALVYLVLRAVLPACTGDSCIGSPRLWVGVALSPFEVFVAFAGAFLALRLRRAWASAGLALPVALLLLGTGAYTLLGGSSGFGVTSFVLAVLAAGCGPLAAVAAAALLNGRRASGWIPGAVVVGLVLAVVLANTLFDSASKVAAVTALAPQPYGYQAPRTRLNTLNTNDYTKILQLEYITSDPSGNEFGDTFVYLHELRPLPAAARSAQCSPALPSGEPQQLCRRVVTPSGVTVWRAGGGDVLGVVVAFPDATVVVSSQQVTDDDAALALVGRLKPVDAADLLDAASSVSVL